MKRVIKVTSNIVVVKQKVEEKTKSGLVIPEMASKGGSMEEFAGEIIATGPDVTKFKKGDFVSFSSGSMSIKRWSNKEYILLKEGALSSIEKEVSNTYKLKNDEFFV